MYLFQQDFDRKGCFWFDKKLIENFHWAALAKSSKTIFPIICSFMNDQGESFPGEQTIAIRAGRYEKAVRAGIMGLGDLKGIKIANYVTKRGRRSKKFTIQRPPNEKGRAFPFYKSLIEGGNWSKLKSSAQALYPVLRHFAYFDAEIYAEAESIEYTESMFDEVYQNRSWELCEAEKVLLAEHAGITRRSINGAFLSLKEHFFVEEVNSCLWKVFLKPTTIYKAKYLNKAAANSMGKNDRS